MDPISENVGTTLVYSDARVRIWLLDLAPRQQTHLHRHTSDYVYVALTPGETVTITQDGGETHSADEVGDAVRHRAGPPHVLRNLTDAPYANVIVELLSRDGS
ncbi:MULTISPECIES: hypothetical protein [unclassified Streptomyces]|uniref:hypothetical protein n=1 Tax=unclassified Streptomyces TaxID=2593676 RepID=UPI001C9CD605|nr:hypothetical protein [Streptomyces sp. me109]